MPKEKSESDQISQHIANIMDLIETLLAPMYKCSGRAIALYPQHQHWHPRWQCKKNVKVSTFKVFYVMGKMLSGEPSSMWIGFVTQYKHLHLGITLFLDL